MSEDRSRKRAVDWEAIERDYRAGIKTLRQIAEEHEITHGAVNKRAKAGGWVRGLKAAVSAGDDRSVALVDEFDAAGFVYGTFIDAGGERFYKIGMAKSPLMRLDGHQTAMAARSRLA